MTMPVWPTSLPNPLVDGANYTPQGGNVIRSEFGGFSKSRRRHTRAYEDFTIRLILSRAQVQTLQDFCAITCADVMPFLWVEHRDPARHEAIYQFRARPSFQPAGSGFHWYADLQLELRTPFSGTFPITDDLGNQLETDTDEGLTT